MSNLIQVEFHDNGTDFSGTYVLDFPSSNITFSGDYIIIVDDNQVGRPFHLGTVKTYKIVSK